MKKQTENSRETKDSSCQTTENRKRNIKIQDIQTYEDLEAIEDEDWDGYNYRYAILKAENVLGLEHENTILIQRDEKKPLDENLGIR